MVEGLTTWYADSAFQGYGQYSLLTSFTVRSELQAV